MLSADSPLIGFGHPTPTPMPPTKSLGLEVFAKTIAASRRLLAELARG
jgi:hypothetical protein